MYVYEGEDYSRSSDSDKKTFDQLLAGEEDIIIMMSTIMCVCVRVCIVTHPPYRTAESV